MNKSSLLRNLGFILTLALVVFAVTHISYLGIASAKEPEKITDNILFLMPCRSWITIRDDGDNQPVVEARTVDFIRSYAHDAAQRWAKDSPQKDWSNADGADISNAQIVHWVTAWCTKNPEDPLAKGALLLSGALALANDRQHLPIP